MGDQGDQDRFRHETSEAPAGAPDLWFYESFQGVASFGLRVKRVLCELKSSYQHIAVYETYQHGRLLALDGLVMVTELDETAYHEMIAHVPMQTLPKARRAAVIGGGDGGTVRELARYPGLEEITLVEIDEQVVWACREHLPSVASGLDDKRVSLKFQDGARFIKDAAPGSLDLIIVDGTDPVGAGKALFTEEFYHHAARAIHDQGVLAAQTESPLYHGPLVKDIFTKVGRAFKNNFMYWAVIPSYPGSIWTFCYASHTRHPLDHFSFHALDPKKLGYYTPELHQAAFAPPALALDCLPQGHPQKEGGPRL
ncbi:MAG: polyamine aminopropyltransferase [bacterium]